MKWLNANLDGLPAHQQEVFISVDGVYHLAVFNSLNQTFAVKDDATKIYPVKEHVIYWMENTPEGLQFLPEH